MNSGSSAVRRTREGVHHLRPDRTYFLYIGEMKALGLNPFLVPCLEEILGGPVDFVAVVPDLLLRYPEANLLVLNPVSRHWERKEGLRVNFRPPAGLFAKWVSRDETVIRLVECLLQTQETLFIHMFESRPEMTLIDGDRIRLLGPDPKVAHRLNNKLYQYRLAQDLGLPVPEGRCCTSLEEVLEAAQEFFRAGEEVFVSEAYSSAGSNSIFASCPEEILRRFSENQASYLVTRRIPHRFDPTVLGVVADEEVYLASVADQRMEGNRFRGSSFPTLLSEGTVEVIKEYTRRIARAMAREGYRGIFGCDYIVDHSGEVYFVEINARKQGTTLESTLTMLHRLPGHPSLPEMEFHAVTRGRLPDGLEEMSSTESELAWATYNVKPQRDVVVTGDLPPRSTERELFRRIYGDPSLGADYVVEEHLGAGIHQMAGGFVARCVAVGKRRSEVEESLVRAVEEVQFRFRPWTPPQRSVSGEDDPQ
jgi:hypothetical protein